MASSRFGSLGNRLLGTPVRGYPLQSLRCIASSTAVSSNNTAANVPATKAPGFLQEKTGVTGAWTLGVGVSAYLISKELYVMGSETVIGVVLGGIIYAIMRNIGTPVAEFLDGKSQGIHDLLSTEKNSRKKEVEDDLAVQASVESELELRHDIFDVMKENNAMRIEEEYRRRLHQVTNTVKRRLDYQVDVEQAQRKFEQQHMVQWLEGTVTELVRGKQDESLAQCMSDLKKMSVA